jgi:hypothetical protein
VSRSEIQRQEVEGCVLQGWVEGMEGVPWWHRVLVLEKENSASKGYSWSKLERVI